MNPDVLKQLDELDPEIVSDIIGNMIGTMNADLERNGVR